MTSTQENLHQLLEYASMRKATDIHLTLIHDHLEIQFRIREQIVPLIQDLWDQSIFEYLKYIAGMDLTNPFIPQSGQFAWKLEGKTIFYRFSILRNQDLQTGVIRILNTHINMTIDELTTKQAHRDFLKQLIYARKGLVIACGPTNSGKTTTLHAILHAISKNSGHKVVSLEDPIEIEDPLYLQLQINEEIGFSYEKGIEELLRHDPDVLLIGETRNSYTAKMVVRAALTGSLAFTTLHASNTLEALERLYDLGITKYELKNTLTVLIGQRLYQASPNKRRSFMKSYPEKTSTMLSKIKHILKTSSLCLMRSLRRLHNIEFTILKRNTIFKISKEEIEELPLLMDKGLQTSFMIEQTFKDHESILKSLESGQSLVSILCSPAGVYFQILDALSQILPLKEAIQCASSLEKAGKRKAMRFLAKMAYPISLFIFSYLMVTFLKVRFYLRCNRLPKPKTFWASNRSNGFYPSG